MDKMNQIKKEILTSMKMMDTTIKGVKESEKRHLRAGWYSYQYHGKNGEGRE